MTTSFRRGLSALVGWLADRRIPRFLRSAVYGTFARWSGADASEAELALDGYPSLGAFFVRRLRPGARCVRPEAELLVSPCDGQVQAVGTVSAGSLLQAKGSTYRVSELLAGTGAEVTLEGAHAWTIYLSPRDYHRVHAPEAGRLGEVRWVPGDRRSVAPKVLAARERVLATNERAVLTLETARGPLYLVLVGALNVGRIRVVGVEPGGAPAPGAAFGRGEELARFEMGSTVVLVVPAGTGAPTPLPDLGPGSPVVLGSPIGRFTA